jgi:uncharacterized protein (TIGR02246 family)
MQNMNKIAFLAAGLVWFAAAAPMAMAAGDAATIRAGSEACIKAYNAGDADAAAALYAQDAIVMPPGAPPARGRPAIKAFLVKDIAGAQAGGVTVVMGSTNDVGVKGDVAWHAGTYSVTNKTGATVDGGAYMEAWRKKGGKWQIIRDTWNSSTPPPAPTAAPAASPATAPKK